MYQAMPDEHYCEQPTVQEVPCRNPVSIGATQCAAGHVIPAGRWSASSIRGAAPTRLEMSAIDAEELMMPERKSTLQTSEPIAGSHLSVSNRPADWLARLADENANSEDIKKGGIDVDQPYQRGEVWTTQQRQLLIKSLLMGVPVPAIIVNDRFAAKYVDPDGDQDWRYAIVDGKQRTLAVVDWFRGDLPVPASWFEAKDVDSTVATEDGEYVTFADLSERGRRRCHNRLHLSVAEGCFSSLAEEAEMFALVNRGGTPMSDEDMKAAFALTSDM